MDHTYEYSNQEHDGEKQNLPHSGVGIASFIIAAVAWILAIVMFATAWSAIVDSIDYVTTLDPYSSTYEDELLEWFETYEDSDKLAALLLIIMTSGGLCFVGLVLGIISLFNKERKKLFPILGTVFSALPLLFPILGLFIGALM